jgi:hypothetical protein
MPRECYKGCDPETDETGIDCDGNFIGEGCVVLEQNTYLDITEGDRLTDFILKVVTKFQGITTALGTKFDKDLPVWFDEAEALDEGMQVGDYFVNSDGFVKRILS